MVSADRYEFTLRLVGTIAVKLEEDISYAPRFERGERTAAIDRLTAEHTTRKAKQR
jgi:hypothetical protein